MSDLEYTELRRPEKIDGGEKRPPCCQVHVSRIADRACKRKPEMKCAACTRHLCAIHRYDKCQNGRRPGSRHGVV